MKVFKNEKIANDSYEKKEELFLNSICPYSKNYKLCGNWCALFYLDTSATPFVILGCKAGEKRLYITEII